MSNSYDQIVESVDNEHESKNKLKKDLSDEGEIGKTLAMLLQTKLFTDSATNI